MSYGFGTVNTLQKNELRKSMLQGIINPWSNAMLLEDNGGDPKDPLLKAAETPIEIYKGVSAPQILTWFK